MSRVIILGMISFIPPQSVVYRFKNILDTAVQSLANLEKDICCDVATFTEFCN